MSTPVYSTETIDRIKKLERMRTLGVNPYATRYETTHSISAILNEFPSSIDPTAPGEHSFRPIESIIPAPVATHSIAGRVLLHRSFGKICFATISDGTGRMQILFSRENCSIIVDGEKKGELLSRHCEDWKDEAIQASETTGSPRSARDDGNIDSVSAYKFAEKLIDLGDFIGVKGELFYTHKGELTLFVSEFSFLTKAIRPLPEKFHGMENDDERYRKRYLDMAMNDELRAMFARKARFWEVIRDFLKTK